jgi:hypothetical protein
VRAYFPRLWWHAYWFEHNWKVQAANLGGRPVIQNPVFILGLWRSGTTVFHELLTAITGWKTPQTWQCFNPSTCFLSGRPPMDRTIDRPMDQGRISTLGPQEDEFAVLLLGESSVYRGFIDPRRLGECAEQLWSSGEGNALADPLTRWREFLRGLNSRLDATPLLLKSPSHTFRLPLLRQLWPRARFVWVARNTGEMLTSNRNMWHAMVASHGLWACPEAVLDDFLRDMLRACAGVLSRCLDDMPRENLQWVDFQELQANPIPELQRVLRFLGPDEQDDPISETRRIEKALAKIPIHAGSRTTVPADESALKLNKLMAAARERFR